jgi:hypothetical protein
MTQQLCRCLVSKGRYFFTTITALQHHIAPPPFEEGIYDISAALAVHIKKANRRYSEPPFDITPLTFPKRPAALWTRTTVTLSSQTTPTLPPHDDSFSAEQHTAVNVFSSPNCLSSNIIGDVLAQRVAAEEDRIAHPFVLSTPPCSVTTDDQQTIDSIHGEEEVKRRRRIPSLSTVLFAGCRAHEETDVSPADTASSTSTFPSSSTSVGQTNRRTLLQTLYVANSNNNNTSAAVSNPSTCPDPLSLSAVLADFIAVERTRPRRRAVHSFINALFTTSKGVVH